MFEYFILGIIQGIAEWLPVSSEGLIVLVKTNFFPGSESGSLEEIIRLALFLHFGTFLAALVYFRNDVIRLLQSIVRYKSQTTETQKLLIFLIVTTLISGSLGLALIKLLSHVAGQFETQGKVITFAIGCLLLITAYLELKSSKKGYREINNLTLVDSLLLGVTQGFTVLPGLSRSGLTVSALLLRKFDKAHALKLSFLMSLPIVLAGNIILNLKDLSWSLDAMAGLASSFIFGLATIHILLKIAQKVNFGYFVLFFGVLTIIAAVI